MNETKISVKEIAERNIFIKNAPEIREISVKQNVDIGIALDMYVAEHKIDRSSKEINDQYQEFRELCREYTLNGVVGMLK